MTPQRQAARLRRISARLPIEADRALRDLAQSAYRDALTLSSGRVRQAVFDTPLGVTTNPATGKRLTLRSHGMASGLGHPYGRGAQGSLGPRGPIPYGDPAVVNAQGGSFFRSWHVAHGGDLVWSVVNDSPHARFLVDGTTRMISRPILGRVAAAARGRARAFGALALYRATH